MRYAAFLRAINVGKHNRITTAELKRVCSAAGLGTVRTYLQSGNLLFESESESESESEAIALRMEAALSAHGLRNAPAVVRSLEELDALVAGDPFAEFPVETHMRYVTLFRRPLELRPPEADESPVRVVAVRDRAILAAAALDRPRGLDINAWLSKQARSEGTTRYFHVVEEVARLLRG